MEISYFPGCTLKTKAKNLENTALPLLNLFDVKAEELEKWYCCGVSFSQAKDNLMLQLAPIRILIRAKESGNKRLLTLCDMCYNTLQRAILFIKSDEENRKKINDFMDREETEFYGDEVEVIHLLSLLKEIGLDEIKKKRTKEADDLKVAPYYGCMLLRPKEVAVDSSEDPSIMEEILASAGCKTVYYPFRTECCGSYQIVNEENIVKAQTRRIVTSASKNGADLIVLSCPLCHYNLDEVQKQIADEDENFKPVPVLYLTQLLGLTMGLDPGVNDFSAHYIDPRPVLEIKGLL